MAERFAQIRVLYRITKEVLDTGQDLPAALDKIVGHLADYGMARGQVTLKDPATGEVRIEVFHGVSRQRQRQGRYRRGEGIVGRVAEEGQPAVVPAIGAEPAFLDRTGARADVDTSGTAYICVPITVVRRARRRRETVGTLGVDVASDRDLDWDRRLLTVVATLIGDAVGEWRDLQGDAVDRARAADRVESGELPPELVGRSRSIREVFRLVEQVAPFDTTVLVRGESGTGKELIARAIHRMSARAEGPFVGVNCGALPESLVESELFGHVRGAFTGAVRDRRGRFEAANGGTLFLDEIGDLPPSAQVKLLRVLQEGEVVRVGEEKPLRVDVRVVAATNAPLEQAIERGRFRPDLFYRLNIFPVHLPPLRERRTDVTLLADHFVEKYSKSFGKKVVRISTPAIELMTAYHWPGNVRELENCIERAVLLSDDGVIRAHHLPPTLQTGDSSGTTQSGSFEERMAAYEREILIEALKNAGGNMSEAARMLGTTQRIIGYRLKKHGLEGLASLRRA